MSFDQEKQQRIGAAEKNEVLKSSALEFMKASLASKYSYNFNWLGRPIIQYPQDMIALQEIVWDVKPDLIIETGIAHGGSLVLSASLLAMLDYCDAVSNSQMVDPRQPKRKVIGIDIDIREHNRKAIEQHPMANRIKMIQGSSIAPEIIHQVNDVSKGYRNILVCLDSNHTQDHVLAELEAYAPLVSLNSYCIVYDGIVEDVPAELSGDRPWGPGDNPKTAVLEYLKTHPEFEIDKNIQQKLLITVAPDGFLKRVR